MLDLKEVIVQDSDSETKLWPNHNKPTTLLGACRTSPQVSALCRDC